MYNGSDSIPINHLSINIKAPPMNWSFMLRVRTLDVIFRRFWSGMIKKVASALGTVLESQEYICVCVYVEKQLNLGTIKVIFK